MEQTDSKWLPDGYIIGIDESSGPDKTAWQLMHQKADGAFEVIASGDGEWTMADVIQGLSNHAAALEARVADLQGVSDANDTLAVALDQERRHSAEMLSQRNQAIDHVRRLHAQVADAAQLLGSISLTHPHLVPAEWAECGPEAKP